MLRTLLILATFAVLVPASVASADTVFAVDVIAKHDVVWDYVDGDVNDACDAWSKGSGTQSLQISSNRREQMRLDNAMGTTLLTGKKAGTYEGLITRKGTWKVNTPSNQPPCSPCGPNSEYGPCGPPNTPAPPLQFDCGTRDARSPMATVGYQQRKGIPALAKGLEFRVWLQPNDYFPNCPPNLPKGMRSPTFKAPWPDWEKLPKSDTARITRLGVGDSVVAEVKHQRSFVEQDGKVVRGEDCVRMPDLKQGYSECAVTEYAITFTRLS